MTHSTITSAGIDVSKHTLDAAIYPSGKSLTVDYDDDGLAQLDAFLDAHGVERTGFEATGGYEMRLLGHLRAQGRVASRFQPVQIKGYRSVRLKRAKSDKLDAALIAEFVAHVPAMPDLPQERFDKLLAELSFLEQVEDQIVVLKTTLETTRLDHLRAMIEDDIVRLKARREERIAAITAQIEEDEELARRYELLLSIKGVAQRTALAFVIRLPELGAATRGEIAALTGVAPYDADSGKSRGKRCIAGGRSRLRKSLYMAAFAASRHNRDLAAFYKRLREAGKPHKTAIVATLRKLVILANTIITRNSPWTEQYDPQ